MYVADLWSQRKSRRFNSRDQTLVITDLQKGYNYSTGKILERLQDRKL